MRERTKLVAERSRMPLRFMFTRVSAPASDEAAAQWLALQRPFRDLRLPRRPIDFTQEADPDRSQSSQRAQVFWRLTVGPTPLALGAQTFPTIQQARVFTAELAAHANDLIVYSVFSDHRRQPLWLATGRDGVPLFIGMPDTYLVATFDPRLSIATALKQATPVDYVHRSAGDPPLQRGSRRPG